MVFEELKAAFPKIRRDEPLRLHSMFRVGGPADYFYELKNVDEIPALLELAEKYRLPVFFFGRGTNLLFRDKGFRGLVIQNISNRLTIEENLVTADSGVLLMDIIRKSVEANLSGLEPLYGLPGTIGGAVFGNAGVPGTEIGNFVEEVVCFNLEEGMHSLAPSNLQFEYRNSRFKKEQKDFVMSVKLRLSKGEKAKSQEQMKAIDEIRRGKQPTGYTAGSFFKNPSKDKPAGMLIEQVGLKGFRLGDAEISPKHANFFMNLGTATAHDILELAKMAQKAVLEKFGVELEPEVRIIGEE